MFVEKYKQREDDESNNAWVRLSFRYDPPYSFNDIKRFPKELHERVMNREKRREIWNEDDFTGAITKNHIELSQEEQMWNEYFLSAKVENYKKACGEDALFEELVHTWTDIKDSQEDNSSEGGTKEGSKGHSGGETSESDELDNSKSFWSFKVAGNMKLMQKYYRCELENGEKYNICILWKEYWQKESPFSNISALKDRIVCECGLHHDKAEKVPIINKFFFLLLFIIYNFQL